ASRVSPPSALLFASSRTAHGHIASQGARTSRPRTWPLAPVHCLIGFHSIGQGIDPIYCRGPEHALLKEWRQSFEQRARGDGIVGSGVGSKEPAFVVIEIDKIEADTTVARRCDLYKPASMRKRPHCWLEHRSADRIQNNITRLLLR